MKCKYCDDKVYFSHDIQRWIHSLGGGDQYQHCSNKKCDWQGTTSLRLLKICPVCGSLLKLNHIAYPVPEQEEKNT